MIPTAAEYIAQRRQRRPHGCTLATFTAAYPDRHLISEWLGKIDGMFRQAKEDGEVVRPAVLRSMEKHLGADKAWTAAQQLHKFNPAVFPSDWYRHMAAWKAAGEPAKE